MKRKYYEEYNIIRVIATLLVVIGHSGYISMLTEYGGIQMWEYNKPILQTLIDLGVRVIYSFHMPLFFALSGALFAHSIKTKPLSYKNLLKSKGRRLLLPYILCNLLWVIPVKLISGYWSGSESIVEDILVGQVFLGGNNHLWYLWALFVITCVAYIFRNNERMRLLIAVIMFVVGVVLDKSNITLFAINRILFNYIWFECGMLYAKYRENIIDYANKKKFRNLMVSIVVYIVILSIYLVLAKGNRYAYALVNISGVVASVVISISLMGSCFVKSKLYTTVLKHSMFIYLLSDTINYPILAVIKATNCRFLIETNIGAMLLFVFRIIFTIGISIVLENVISRGRLFVRKKRGIS